MTTISQTNASTSTKADKDEVKWLLENETAYRISQQTGISESTLARHKKGNSKLGNMKMDNAIVLTKLAKEKRKELAKKAKKKKQL